MNKATILLATAMILTTPSFSANKIMTKENRKEIIGMLTVNKQKPMAEKILKRNSEQKEQKDGPNAPKTTLPANWEFILPEETRVPGPKSDTPRKR